MLLTLADVAAALDGEQRPRHRALLERLALTMLRGGILERGNARLKALGPARLAPRRTAVRAADGVPLAHGLAILDQLRTRLPQTQSFPRTRETMVEGREPALTAARLDRLRPAEAALSGDQVSDAPGAAVRVSRTRDTPPQRQGRGRHGRTSATA